MPVEQTPVRGFQQNELGPGSHYPHRSRELRLGPSWRHALLRSQQRATRRASEAVRRRQCRHGVARIPSRVPDSQGLPAVRALRRRGGCAGTNAEPDCAKNLRRSGLRRAPVSASIRRLGPFASMLGTTRTIVRPGAAFVLGGEAGGEQPLYCVSPGNNLPVTERGALPPLQAEGPCPASFAPARGRTFIRRLTFQLAIGQAF